MLNMSVLSLIQSSNFCFITSVSLHKHLVRETFFDMASEKPVIALISCVKCFHKRYTWVWREGTMCVIHIFMLSISLELMNVEQELKTNSWPFKFANVHYNVENLSFFPFFFQKMTSQWRVFVKRTWWTRIWSQSWGKSLAWRTMTSTWSSPTPTWESRWGPLLSLALC